VFLSNPIFCLSNQFENVQTFFWWKKSLNVSNVKLLSIFFQHFMGFLILFCFQALIKGKQVSICWFFTFYCLKQPLKLKVFQNSLRKKRCLQNCKTSMLVYLIQLFCFRIHSVINQNN
jgi:hypothetical protein